MERVETLKDWQRWRRHSLLALKIQTPLTVLLVLGLWALSHVVSFAAVLAVVSACVGALAFVGDLVNVIYCSHKIKQLQESP